MKVYGSIQGSYSNYSNVTSAKNTKDKESHTHGRKKKESLKDEGKFQSNTNTNTNTNSNTNSNTNASTITKATSYDDTSWDHLVKSSLYPVQNVPVIPQKKDSLKSEEFNSQDEQFIQEAASHGQEDDHSEKQSHGTLVNKAIEAYSRQMDPEEVEASSIFGTYII